MFRRQSVYLTLIFIWVASTSCKKNNVESRIPNVAVNEFVYLSNPSSFNLQVQGGWVYNPGGYRGLLVYRRYYNFGIDDFIAYDRACPDHYMDGCSQMKVVDDLYLECDCSGHRYLLFDGQPISNSQQQLKFYNTQFDGSNIIQITN